ncbi:MAG: pyridoxal-5-phosphate-dependent protein subunit beta [Ignavibacteria bacterium RIFOXYC2_FULL_35_16]|nr:MAG: pyridoxal-5-phosphate-dependent protein subunit beta [Ignavibacteria bacterium GWA2_36_19]OGU62429.1 MAG: pyridoxal-5-phosphate-dependent protein subunit beta [Ignavibacteria bacterium GWF2_35_20]OGU79021.1 MAG: pyridoxal-5-phosphate-dependent protein subunit beta [Ignavibacteria bacterium RIFOXYA2_FULL_35_9]OGU87428.1 MAG: pyridoxal-5-phosphate-dependent protein subunit beta [Ignavibacteria bacterium RIFOXYA12_FULL_35_25]OGU90083.1 MAG: pyridoxal-5-phosphate-dependent protein subunit b
MNNWNWQLQDKSFLEKSIKRCREKEIILPTFKQLKDPESIPKKIQEQLETIDLNALHPLNLFRINWRNDKSTGKIGEINYLEIPREITGVKARIIGLIGKYFPTGAHKVGATYGCLVPYLVTGRFNPEYHKAVWPSTGNYCRGGAFNSALLAVHAVAILPEEMSKERFDWLREIGAEVFATYGCESNVKEIYDKCHELEKQSDEYLIFNQFNQFGNSIWHYNVTGSTIETLFNQIKKDGQRLSGFVSATGSAGTIGAGDYLREKFPLINVTAAEALQCPTLLMNGFGAHRIEGIGDKHVPWIHNVKNTNSVAAIDDEQPLRILRLFNEPEGQKYLSRLGVDEQTINKLPDLGISSIANLLAAIKLTKYNEYNENDVIFTIFTDSSDMYQSRLKEMNDGWGNYSLNQAGIDWNVALKNQSIDYFKELSYYDKKAIHNLKYFTWVEQQGKTVEELNTQWYDENYWKERFAVVPKWDKLIEEFNSECGIEKNL